MPNTYTGNTIHTPGYRDEVTEGLNGTKGCSITIPWEASISTFNTEMCYRSSYHLRSGSKWMKILANLSLYVVINQFILYNSAGKLLGVGYALC